MKRAKLFEVTDTVRNIYGVAITEAVTYVIISGWVYFLNDKNEQVSYAGHYDSGENPIKMKERKFLRHVNLVGDSLTGRTIQEI